MLILAESRSPTRVVILAKKDPLSSDGRGIYELKEVVYRYFKTPDEVREFVRKNKIRLDMGAAFTAKQ